MQHTTPSTAHSATAASNPQGANVLNKFTRLRPSHTCSIVVLQSPTIQRNYNPHMPSVIGFLGPGPIFCRISCVLGLLHRPPQLRTARRVPATAGHMSMVAGYFLNVKGRQREALGQMAPLQRSRVEDESVVQNPIFACSPSSIAWVRCTQVHTSTDALWNIIAATAEDTSPPAASIAIRNN